MPARLTGWRVAVSADPWRRCIDMKASTRALVAVIAVVGAIVAAPRAARAQLEVHLGVKPNEDPKAREAGTNAPFIEATVIGGAPPDLAKLSLTETDAKPAPISIKAS